MRWDRFQVNDRAISCGQRYRRSPKRKRLEKSKPTVSPSIVVAKEATETALLSSSESCHQASESSESGCTGLMLLVEVKSGETTNPSTSLFCLLGRGSWSCNLRVRRGGDCRPDIKPAAADSSSQSVTIAACRFKRPGLSRSCVAPADS